MENLCYHCGKTFETEEDADFCSQDCIDLYEKCSYNINTCPICCRDDAAHSGVDKILCDAKKKDLKRYG